MILRWGVLGWGRCPPGLTTIDRLTTGAERSTSDSDLSCNPKDTRENYLGTSAPRHLGSSAARQLGSSAARALAALATVAVLLSATAGVGNASPNDKNNPSPTDPPGSHDPITPRNQRGPVVPRNTNASPAPPPPTRRHARPDQAINQASFPNGTAIYVSPHEDDEGEAWTSWSLQSGYFPIFVYVTNGENSGYCAGSPRNTAYPLPIPPQNYGAEGDNPQFFPMDPPLTPQTGWSPLENAGQDASGDPLNGPCRAQRLDSTINFLAQAQYDVNPGTPMPSLSLNQPPDGQACFPANYNIEYEAAPGQQYNPITGITSGIVSGYDSVKDPCAYYWDTPTGDVVIFNLGDLDMPWYQSNVNVKPLLPANRPGYLSTGNGQADPNQASTVQYTASPADVVWAIEQLTQYGPTIGVIPTIPTGIVAGSGFYNPPPFFTGAGGQPCVHYYHANHDAVWSALYYNTVVANVYNVDRTCGGDPRQNISEVGTVAHYDSLFASNYNNAQDNAYSWDLPSSAPSSTQNCIPGQQQEGFFDCVAFYILNGHAPTVAPVGTNTGGM